MKAEGISILIPIDIQKGFDDPVFGHRNNPELERNLERLFRIWRETGNPIIHVRHDSKNPESVLRNGKKGFNFKDEALPLQGERVITKHVHSAFIGTELRKVIEEFQNPELYFCGITTDHCVSTSVRMASDYGFPTTLIYDCCATFDRKAPDNTVIEAQMVHDSAISSLDHEFCKVIHARDI